MILDKLKPSFCPIGRLARVMEHPLIQHPLILNAQPVGNRTKCMSEIGFSKLKTVIKCHHSLYLISRQTLNTGFLSSSCSCPLSSSGLCGPIPVTSRQGPGPIRSPRLKRPQLRFKHVHPQPHLPSQTQFALWQSVHRSHLSLDQQSHPGHRIIVKPGDRSSQGLRVKVVARQECPLERPNLITP